MPESGAHYERTIEDAVSIVEADDPRIRESIAIRRDRIDREGEVLLFSMEKRGLQGEPVYACCPKCGWLYGLYVNNDLCDCLRSIHEAYLTLVGFLESNDQCPKHLRTEITVRSLLYEEEVNGEDKSRSEEGNLEPGA
jgi:hypothetical protein